MGNFLILSFFLLCSLGVKYVTLLLVSCLFRVSHSRQSLNKENLFRLFFVCLCELHDCELHDFISINLSILK